MDFLVKMANRKTSVCTADIRKLAKITCNIISADYIRSEVKCGGKMLNGYICGRRFEFRHQLLV
jgi:hypothetical protein